jgi:hypothetical protein
MSRRAALTPQQEYVAEYLHQSHQFIPTRQSHLRKMKIPFCIGVTPFPRNREPPPLLPANFHSCPSCCRCRGKAAKGCVPCLDRSGWVCSICGDRNLYSPSRPMSSDSLQVQIPIWDAFAFRHSARVDVARVPPIQHRSPFHLLALELSDFSLPLFLPAIDGLVRAAEGGSAFSCSTRGFKFR